MVNYYNIDDVLVEEELYFTRRVNGVRIDESAEKGYVEQGSKAELPFWLAYELHLRQAVSTGVPACFNQRLISSSLYHLKHLENTHFPETRLEIQADAACADLRSRCSYFYEFGCKLAPLCDKTIGLLLSYAFRIQFKEVLHKAHATAYAAASKFLSFLTKEETNSQSSMASFKKWRMGGPRLQRASILGRKRRPVE